jgi:hypothetical protein
MVWRANRDRDGYALVAVRQQGRGAAKKTGGQDLAENTDGRRYGVATASFAKSCVENPDGHAI